MYCICYMFYGSYASVCLLPEKLEKCVRGVAYVPYVFDNLTASQQHNTCVFVSCLALYASQKAMLAREDAKTFSVDTMHFQTSSECMFMTRVCSVFCSVVRHRS